MKPSALFHFSFFLFTLTLLSGLVLALGRTPSLPQLADGGDVLSVMFGDAREVLSRAAVHKADSYFHGGTDMKCDDLHEGHDEHDKRDGHDDGHVCDGHCHQHDDDPREVARDTMEGWTARGTMDIWKWINSRIRAPQEHKHLEGTQAVEMLPWFWAAVKSDPHNAGAWSDAWYTAAHVMKDKAMAARILEEAREKNPESIEIAFTEGRALYDNGHGDLVAAKAAFARAIALGDAKCRGDVSKLTSREEEAYRFASNYLENLNKKSVK